jgi:hypothetical protein
MVYTPPFSCVSLTEAVEEILQVEEIASRLEREHRVNIGNGDLFSSRNMA